MSSKSINISEEAYERLNSWKKSNDESFTDVIIRVLPQKRNLSEILECLEPIDEETAEEMKKAIDDEDSA
ncbi:antitoxin VapB family protein [Methanoplanus endosymbiosus]|jgi:predicted CopG family antitoxin|uniref:Antitoxin VapB family protein n=1 Tax=Methanoplanus endosymbiosus TaxID=33865 RepID=A0A9E7PMD2_9EURY|nr:antitoxin VapB family protein [Methanoplanus endosymbiosus]UUX92530.1 antitoxin VapB family protein [Methanoplanus endosymbiosus]